MAYITIRIIVIEIQLSNIESSELQNTVPSVYRTVEGEFHGATVELNADIEVSLDFVVYQSTSNSRHVFIHYPLIRYSKPCFSCLR